MEDYQKIIIACAIVVAMTLSAFTMISISQNFIEYYTVHGTVSSVSYSWFSDKTTIEINGEEYYHKGNTHVDIGDIYELKVDMWHNIKNMRWIG